MFPRNFRKEILVHFFATQMRAALDSRYHKYRNHNRYLHRVGFQKLQPAAIPGRSVLVKKGSSTVWSREIFSWFWFSLPFLNYCKMAKRAFLCKICAYFHMLAPFFLLTSSLASQEISTNGCTGRNRITSYYRQRAQSYWWKLVFADLKHARQNV